MRIKELNIRNFRIFKGDYKLDFQDKNLIIIYGNNGNGKSTMFDAIEWAITGELLRYKGSTERSKFNYIFNNKVYGTEACEVFVEIIFNNDGKEIKIKRLCKCNRNGKNPKTTIFINDKDYGEQEGSQRIREIIVKSSENQDVLDRGKFRDMFSATQLLSQDEIADFVSSKKPSDRLSVMEKILGVDRYGEDFREYIKKCCSNLGCIIEEKNIEKLKLEDNISKVENKILNINTKILTIEEHNKKLGSKSESDILKELEVIREQELELSINEIINEYKCIDYNVQREILNNKKYLLSEIKNKELLYNKIINYRDEKLENKNIEVEKEQLEDKNSLLVKRVDRREKSISYYEKKINEMSSVIFAKKELEKYNQLIKNNNELIKNKIEQINSLKNLDILKELIEEFKSTDNFKDEFINKKNKRIWLEGLLLHLNTIIEIKELDNKNNEIQISIKMLHKKIEELEVSLDRVDKILINTNNKSEEQFKSINQKVFEIQSDIIEKRNDKKCPVCGEEFNSILKFIERIERQLEISKSYFSEIDNEIRELGLEKSKLLEQKRAIKSKINSLKREIEKNSNIKNEKIILIEKNKTQYNNYENSNINDIKIILEENIKFIDKNSFKYELILSINNLEAELNTLKLENKDLFIRIDKVYIRHNFSKKYIDKPDIEINRIKSKYENYIFYAKQSVNSLIKDINKYTDIIKLYNKKINNLKNTESEIIEELNNFNYCKDEKEKNIEHISKYIMKLKSIENNLNSILEYIEQSLSQEEIRALKKSIIKLSKEKDEVQKQMSALNTKIENAEKDKASLEIIFENSKDIQSKLIGKLIENYSEFIDRLFFQISPHAFAKHIYMIPRKTELYIILSEAKGRREELLSKSDEELKAEANASLTLSSAQKNVLGICIFISLSLSQEWTNLEIMGIDDPFQNMDDINVYSFLDTLSGILDKKQVMISTHDEDFAALISNKSILDNNKIKIIELETYSQEGVRYIERN